MGKIIMMRQTGDLLVRDSGGSINPELFERITNSYAVFKADLDVRLTKVK